MRTILLVTSEHRLVAEFEAIAAATGHALEVAPDTQRAPVASHVFLDPASAIVGFTHPNVVVVTLDPPGPTTWAAAAAVNAVHIAELPRERDWVVAHVHVPEVSRGTLVGIEPMVGGAGASTLAIALAHHLAKRGKRTAVVDLDPDGALDILAGLEGIDGPRWPDIDLMALAGADLAQQLPCVGEVAVLSSDVRRPTLAPDLDAVTALQDTCDFVIMDLAAGHRMSLPAADFTCAVIPNTVRAVAVAGRRLGHGYPGSRGLVVRNVAGAGLDPMAVGEVLGIPVWAGLPSDPRVVEQIEQGLGPSTISLGGYTRAVLHLANRVLGDDAATLS